MSWLGRRWDSAVATVDEIAEVATDVKNIAANVLDLDVKTEAAGATKEERDAQFARAKRAGERSEAVREGADATIQVYKDVAKFTDSQIEGMDEFITGSRSDAAVKEYMDTKIRIDQLATNKDDAGLMKEYKAQVDGRLTSLEARKKDLEGKDKPDAAEIEKLTQLIESTKVMKSVELEPGKALNDQQREQLAKDTKKMSGLKASSEVSRLTGKMNDAARLTEDSLIMGAQLIANFAAPGIGGLVISQAVGIADQSGALGEPSSGEKHGGAIAKLVTGNGENVTWKDVVADGVDVVVAAIPGGKALGKPVANAVEKQVITGVEKEVVKAGEKELVKAGEKTLLDRAKGIAGGQLQSQTAKFVKKEAPVIIEEIAGSPMVADATRKAFGSLSRTVAGEAAQQFVSATVPDSPVIPPAQEPEQPEFKESKIKSAITAIKRMAGRGNDSTPEEMLKNANGRTKDVLKKALDLDGDGKVSGAELKAVEDAMSKKTEKGSTKSSPADRAAARRGEEREERPAKSSPADRAAARRGEEPEERPAKSSPADRAAARRGEEPEERPAKSSPADRAAARRGEEREERPAKSSPADRTAARGGMTREDRPAKSSPADRMSARVVANAKLGAADLDGDGKLSKDEATVLLEKLDTDKSGTVTMEEMLKGKTGMDIKTLSAVLKSAGVEFKSEGKSVVAVVPQTPMEVSNGKSEESGRA